MFLGRKGTGLVLNDVLPVSGVICNVWWSRIPISKKKPTVILTQPHIRSNSQHGHHHQQNDRSFGFAQCASLAYRPTGAPQGCPQSPHAHHLGRSPTRPRATPMGTNLRGGPAPPLAHCTLDIGHCACRPGAVFFFAGAPPHGQRRTADFDGIGSDDSTSAAAVAVPPVFTPLVVTAARHSLRVGTK